VIEVPMVVNAGSDDGPTLVIAVMATKAIRDAMSAYPIRSWRIHHLRNRFNGGPEVFIQGSHGILQVTRFRRITIGKSEP
jgi:hypothetical protein